MHLPCSLPRKRKTIAGREKRSMSLRDCEHFTWTKIANPITTTHKSFVKLGAVLWRDTDATAACKTTYKPNFRLHQNELGFLFSHLLGARWSTVTKGQVPPRLPNTVRQESSVSKDISGDEQQISFASEDTVFFPKTITSVGMHQLSSRAANRTQTHCYPCVSPIQPALQREEKEELAASFFAHVACQMKHQQLPGTTSFAYQRQRVRALPCGWLDTLLERNYNSKEFYRIMDLCLPGVEARCGGWTEGHVDILARAWALAEQVRELARRSVSFACSRAYHRRQDDGTEMSCRLQRCTSCPPVYSK